MFTLSLGHVGIDVNRQLLTAVWERNETRVKTSLAKGANINYRGPAYDQQGSKVRRNTTALIIASENGELNIVKLLIHRKAKLDLRDQDGNTALHAATDEGHIPVVRVLLEHGANYEIKNPYGNTALDLTYRPEQPALDKSAAIRKLILQRKALDRK